MVMVLGLAGNAVQAQDHVWRPLATPAVKLMRPIPLNSGPTEKETTGATEPAWVGQPVRILVRAVPAEQQIPVDSEWRSVARPTAVVEHPVALATTTNNTSTRGNQNVAGAAFPLLLSAEVKLDLTPTVCPSLPGVEESGYRLSFFGVELKY